MDLRQETLFNRQNKIQLIKLKISQCFALMNIIHMSERQIVLYNIEKILVEFHKL